MSPSLVVADCPECRGVGTVFMGTCEVCFAEFFDGGETISHGGGRADPLLSAQLVADNLPAVADPFD